MQEFVFKCPPSPKRIDLYWSRMRWLSRFVRSRAFPASALPRELLGTASQSRSHGTAAQASSCHSPSIPNSCWKCQATLPTAATLFCPNSPCSVIQPLDSERVNFYELFSVPGRTLVIDPAALEASYKSLQRLLHPDKFATHSPDERRISAENSSLVNQGFQVLKSRVERTAYVLRTFHGIRVLEEGGSYRDPPLMAEMFELRERVDEVGDRAAAEAMLREQDGALETIGNHLEASLQRGDVDGATKLAVRLKYLSKVVDELAAKAEE